MFQTLLFCSALLTAGSACAEEVGRTLRLEAGQKSPTATIEDARWLAGRWEGKGLGGTIDEAYSPPAGGAMVGHYRLVREGKVAFYEILTIVERDGSLVYRLKHFGPDLVGWEEKGVAVEFPLVKKTPDALYFDGMTLERLSPGRMRIWVRIEDRKTGRTRDEPFDYRLMQPVG